jgi:acetyltransferase
MHLDTLFNPRAVAVIGASSDPKKVGYALLKNILEGGAREVYPVTLGSSEIMGRATHTSVKMVPGPVDLAVIAVRADVVPSILLECAEKDIHAAVIISAGFKEVGEEGKKLEEEIARIAEEKDITLLGPNCLGIMNAHADWNASFAVHKPKAGGVAFVSQSGALGTALLDWANEEGVWFSKFVSLGNEAALSELEFLEYLADDTETKAVLLYLEQVKDGKRFMELAERVTEKKPLVVLRAGRSARGSAAVASHTGSLAPSDKIFEAALKQVGAIPVDSLNILFSLSKLFELGLTEPLQNIVILTNGGGPSVNTADLIEQTDTLTLSTFDDETKEKLKAVLPPMAAVGNPIDVIGDAGPDRYEKTLEILVTQESVDAILTMVTPQMMTDPKGIADVVLAFHDKKPLIPVFMGGETVYEGREHMEERGVVSFRSPVDVVVALDALARGKEKPLAPKPEPGPRLAPELVMYSFKEMSSLLADYDAPLEGVFARNEDELGDALKKVGDGPYAMKAISASLVHKSDLRAVELGLADEDAVRAAWGAIVAHVHQQVPDAQIDGMLIQPMVQGVECIIGMKRDPVFGPVVVFGLGGIFVEILKDSSMRIAPVTKEEALAQISKIKGLPLLTGARGRTPVNLDVLAELVSAIAHLSLDYPEIEEIDLNPAFATPEGAHIVDARIMKHPAS